MNMSFDEWTKSVDALCLRHLLCVWSDLCGDLEPLASGYESELSPKTFVQWWADKYDLKWVDRADPHMFYF